MTANPTGRMERTSGRHKTRRMGRTHLGGNQHPPCALAAHLVTEHNAAVRAYGSDCGGFHAFDVAARSSAGVWNGEAGYPPGSVVTPLAWGLISDREAQRVLEMDGHGGTDR